MIRSPQSLNRSGARGLDRPHSSISNGVRLVSNDATKFEVPLGKPLTVEIIAKPTNAAATKTLQRVFRNDPRIERYHRHMQNNRPSLRTKQRGGRQWPHRMKTHSAAKLDLGTTYNLVATVSIARDLASVQRFIKVSPA